MLNSNKIFVGNIPFEYDEESLKRVLSLVGPIENFEIKKTETHKNHKDSVFARTKASKSRKVL